jgi:hypothetical protein
MFIAIINWSAGKSAECGRDVYLTVSIKKDVAVQRLCIIVKKAQFDYPIQNY